MKTNKMGIHVRRNKNGFLDKVFGIITKNAQAQLHKRGDITENAYLDEQREKTLLEADVKKSQAIEFVRKLQNH